MMNATSHLPCWSGMTLSQLPAGLPVMEDALTGAARVGSLTMPFKASPPGRRYSQYDRARATAGSVLSAARFACACEWVCVKVSESV